VQKVCVSLMGLILLSFLSSGPCAAAADWREGKDSFRSVCSSCHKTRGEAGRISLNSKTRAEWSAFFSQSPAPVHQQAWGKLDKDGISSLELYFRKHAKDVKELLGCG